MIYSFDIDEKSLFRGVTNDYKNGQSATVHTPLNQSADRDNWRNDIYSFLEGYSSENKLDLPDVLKDKCLRKTTSRAESEILYFYEFSHFSLDGIPFYVDASYAIYVKREISQTIEKRDGLKGINSHFGREKLHYRIDLSHKADGYNIDNHKVLDAIFEVNGGFAYMVKGFDVDTEKKTLNFRTSLIGLKGVLLSNVFRKKKGVGSKLLIDDSTFIKHSLDSHKNNDCSEEAIDAFYDTIEKIRISSKTSGRLGEEYVFNNIDKILGTEIKDPVYVSQKYPQSPYDIECVLNDKKVYVEVKSTKGDKKVFYMSRGERRFMDKYAHSYVLVLVTNVTSKPKHVNYRRDDIMTEKKMLQEPQSIKFIVV